MQTLSFSSTFENDQDGLHEFHKLLYSFNVLHPALRSVRCDNYNFDCVRVDTVNTRDQWHFVFVCS